MPSSPTFSASLKDTSQHLSAIVLLFLALFVSSCSSSETVAPTPAKEEPQDSTAIKAAIQHEQDSIYTAFFVQEYISNLLAEGNGVIRGEELFSDVMLPELYEKCAYQLLWKDSVARTHALETLGQAHLDGLLPEDYHYAAISDLMTLYGDDYEVKAGLDILITDGIILYGTHLLNGKTDPKSLEPTLSYQERVLSDEVLEALRQRIVAGDVQSIIEQLRPPSKYYQAMIEGLQYYEMLADSGGWETVRSKERKLEPGERYVDIISIRERMLVEGDLLETDLVSSADTTVDRQIYDPALQRAVERFQLRHGLNADGVIGKGTLAAMNIPVEKKVKLLKANMERARWIHHDLDSNFVLVNIAGFDLRLVKHGSLLWSTKVMTGKIATATPVFRDEMLYLEVNPYWTVPFSISNGEILPKLKQDSTYLARNNMELLSMSGKTVNPNTLDFDDFEAKMPYIVRQGPGPGNSLGRVKFLFPNRFSIYLHDTPSRSLFARQSRAFSHGCIRVQDPLKFAELVLQDQEVSRHEIDSLLASKDNHRINLDHALPVIITYSTAFADTELVYFYEDIYKRDNPLMRALGL